MNPIITFDMESGHSIQVELYPEVAPITVANFIKLVEDKFYDGLTFHRVIPGFMIQGGCPKGTGVGGPGHQIKGEFTSNGVNNELKHERGVISMARAADPNSAGSQFFLMVKDSKHLDGQYAGFGRIISGIEEADRIVSVKRDMRDMPVVAQVIKTVTVQLNGYTSQ